MIEKDDMKIVELSQIEECVASFFAEKREIFEYPRDGYGNYNNRGTDIIKNGLLGELAFFSFIYQHIEGKYRDKEASERNAILRNKFSYKIVVGDYDEGFEFKLNNKTVDVKTYATEYVNFDEIYDRPLNLLVDIDQNACADIYVQAFILKNNRICIAGYSNGLPERINRNMPKPAYACRVPELLPISELVEAL